MLLFPLYLLIKKCSGHKVLGFIARELRNACRPMVCGGNRTLCQMDLVVGSRSLSVAMQTVDRGALFIVGCHVNRSSRCTVYCRLPCKPLIAVHCLFEFFRRHLIPRRARPGGEGASVRETLICERR